MTEFPKNERPRERLEHIGARALSDQELLAIILRTGYKDQSVIALAQTILDHFEHLYHFKEATIPELMAIKGLGKVKAIELKAILEFGWRVHRASQPKLGKVNSSYGLGNMLVEELKDAYQEELIAIYLNTKNEIIQQKRIFVGSLNQSVAHPREIFRYAVRISAAKAVIVHNHPSGNPEPSQQDIAFTKRMRQAGELLGIELLDHLIIGEDRYYSIREEGDW